jgi:hypothetical protein
VAGRQALASALIGALNMAGAPHGGQSITPMTCTAESGCVVGETCIDSTGCTQGSATACMTPCPDSLSFAHRIPGEMG